MSVPIAIPNSSLNGISFRSVFILEIKDLQSVLTAEEKDFANTKSKLDFPAFTLIAANGKFLEFSLTNARGSDIINVNKSKGDITYVL